MIRYNDALERRIGEALDQACIPFIYESDCGPNQAAPCFGLDFYLPTLDVHIEIKQFHSARIAGQMERAANVIALQGRIAVDLFADMIVARCNRKDYADAGGMMADNPPPERTN